MIRRMLRKEFKATEVPVERANYLGDKAKVDVLVKKKI